MLCYVVVYYSVYIYVYIDIYIIYIYIYIIREKSDLLVPGLVRVSLRQLAVRESAGGPSLAAISRVNMFGDRYLKSFMKSIALNPKP